MMMHCVAIALTCSYMALFVSAEIPATATISPNDDCYRFSVEPYYCKSRDSYEARLVDVAFTSECHKIATERNSTFFIYNQNEGNCDLFDMSVEKFYESCDDFFGPSAITRSECLASNTPCAGFRHTDCHFGQYSYIGKQLPIDDEETCQNICKATPSCAFYQYYFYQAYKPCQLFNFYHIECHAIIGENMSADFTSSLCNANSSS